MSRGAFVSSVLISLALSCQSPPAAPAAAPPSPSPVVDAAVATTNVALPDAGPAVAPDVTEKLAACAAAASDEPPAKPLALNVVQPTFADFPESEVADDGYLKREIEPALDKAKQPIVTIAAARAFPAVSEDGSMVVNLSSERDAFRSYSRTQTVYFLSTRTGKAIAHFEVGKFDLSPAEGKAHLAWLRKQAQDVRAANAELVKHTWIHLDAGGLFGACASDPVWSKLDAEREKDSSRIHRAVRLHRDGLDLDLIKGAPAKLGAQTVQLRMRQGESIAPAISLPVQFSKITRNACELKKSAPGPENADAIAEAFGSRARGFVFVVPYVLLGGDCVARYPDYESVRILRFPAAGR